MLHKAPSHPSMQMHWKALTLSTHVPPFSHGFTLQSLISAKRKYSKKFFLTIYQILVRINLKFRVYG